MEIQVFRKHQIRLGVAVSLFGVWCFFFVAGVPFLFRYLLEEKVPDQIGQPVFVEKIRCSPFSLRLVLQNVVVGKKEAPGIAISEVVFDPAFWRSVFSRQVVMGEVVLRDPAIRLTRNQDGSLDPAGLAFSPSTRKSPGQMQGMDESQEETVREEGPVFVLKRFLLTGGSLQFDDHRAGFSETLSAIRLSGRNLSTGKDASGRFAGSLHLSTGGTVSWDLGVGLAPLRVEGDAAVGGVLLSAFSPYFPEKSRGQLVSGEISAGCDLLFSDQTLTLPDLRGHLRNVLVRQEDGRDFFRLGELRVAAGPIAVSENRFTIHSITCMDPELFLSYAKEGFLLPRTRTQSRLTASSGADLSHTPGPVVHLGALRIRNGRVGLTDQTRTPVVQMDVADLAITAGPLSYPPTGPISCRLDAKVEKTGKVGVQGVVTPEPFALSLDLSVSGFPLSLGSPYLQEMAALQTNSGQLDAKGRVTFGSGEGLQFRGALGGNHLSLSRKGETQPFFRMEKLRLADVFIKDTPMTAVAGSIGVSGVRFRVDRDAQGWRPFVKTKTGKEPKAAPETPSASQPVLPSVRIHEIRLKDADILFTDRSVEPVFHTELNGLAGKITGIDTTDPQIPFSLAMKAKQDRYAPVTISGKGNAVDFYGATQLQFAVKHFEIPGGSPYSRVYTGHPLEKGKMHIGLDWRIHEGRLKAVNEVRVDGLKIGAPTGKGHYLPIGLAQALLEDRHGIIDIRLPVAGHVEDPEFRVGPAIWKAFTGLVTKIATAPFTAMASLFGGKSLSSLSCLPGEAVVPATEVEKVEILAKGLRERPRLTLEIRPEAGPEDRDAMALQQITETMAAKVAMGEDPVLLRAKRFEKETGKDAGDFTDREITARLVAAEEVPQEALRSLARERGLLVKGKILATEGVLPEQVFLTAPVVGKGAMVRFSLEARR